MSGARLAVLLAAMVMVPLTAAAQAAPAPATPGRLWIVAGGAATTKKGDCRNCEEPGPYIHTSSVLVDGGVRVNGQMDVGGEFMWVPGEASTGDQNRATIILAISQFRPWSSQGFFLKGGMGMAFVRNWVYTGGSDTKPPYTSKALSVVYGGGWEFLRGRRIGAQVYGTHHAVTLGDLETSKFRAENIMGNVWSAGAAIVIR